jgi:hypothetical protein
MPRYRLVWLEIAEAQYRALSPSARAVVDARLVGLLDAPTGARDTIYERGSDQWSVPLPGVGYLVYAVVADPPTLIVERVMRVDPARLRLFRIILSWAGRRWFWPRA